MIEATINIQTTQIRRSIRSQVRKDFSPVYRFPRAHPTEAERAAEKGHFWGRISPRVAGAKAPFSHFKQLMARLKSCPFAHLRQGGVFPQAVKSCPRKKQDCRLNKKGSPQNSMPDPLIEQRAAPTQRVPRWGTVSLPVGRRSRWATVTKRVPSRTRWWIVNPLRSKCRTAQNDQSA